MLVLTAMTHGDSFLSLLCAFILSDPVTPSTLFMPIMFPADLKGMVIAPPLTFSKIQNIEWSCESFSAIMWLFTLLQPTSWIFYSSAHLWVHPDPRSPPRCHILSLCYFPWCCILFLYFLWPQEAVDLFLNVLRGFLLFSRLSLRLWLSHVFSSFSYLTFLFLCTLLGSLLPSACNEHTLKSCPVNTSYQA